MGWFEHGSTIIVLAPRGYALAAGIASGRTVKAGAALLERCPARGAHPGPSTR
jgi:phosphatidylserine decarboxylase